VKKRLILVAIERHARDKYMQALREFFQDSLEIIGYYTNEQQLPAQLKCDLVLYTSQELVPIIRSRITETTNILLLRRVLVRREMQRLYVYPPGTKAVLFDYTEETAKYMISQILDCGYHNISFTPLGRDSTPQARQQALSTPNQLLVIVGLGDLVTISMPEIIDLGWAAIDPNELLEIAVLLRCFTDRMEQKLLQYIQLTSNANHGILYFLRSIMESQNRYQTVVELLEDGILVYQKDGYITHCNDSFANGFHLSKNQVVRASLHDLPLPKALHDLLLSHQPVEDKWVPGGASRSSFTVSIYEVGVLSEVVDYVAVIRSSDRVQRRSSQIRLNLKSQGFRAKYTFDHILGRSDAIQTCRKIAEHIAHADGPVLITGETGTGKELFAQAIHNASTRRNMPFVALNCAALTPTLLESELFGYEAGAFTGSKAEGHIGLFECAHEGTVFLDEIGEMPMELQAKLLRVLEEHEVRPVGSHRIVPVNVRIIAATNQDLYRQMEEKHFRADLFYRLSLFPLRLPPLRERPEDIPLLAHSFLDRIRQGVTMTDRLLQTLMHLEWRGNIRELRNYIQYMESSGSSVLDIDVLPPQPHVPADRDMPPWAKTEALPAASRQEQRLMLAILKTLQNDTMSRATLTQALTQQNLSISEYKVRQLLTLMREHGLLTYGTGRGGIRLTQHGMFSARQL
jgi:transcriptional regulator with PAS, ATPase and Fis domain